MARSFDIVVASFRDWLAGPFSFTIPQANTLQHMATCLVRPPPGITNLIGMTTLMAAICNGTADPSPASSDTGTVPNHTILWTLPSLANALPVASVLVITHLFNVRFRFTAPALTRPITGTDHDTAQVCAFPLLVNVVNLPIVRAIILISIEFALATDCTQRQGQ